MIKYLSVITIYFLLTFGLNADDGDFEMDVTPDKKETYEEHLRNLQEVERIKKERHQAYQKNVQQEKSEYESGLGGFEDMGGPSDTDDDDDDYIDDYDDVYNGDPDRYHHHGDENYRHHHGEGRNGHRHDGHPGRR